MRNPAFTTTPSEALDLGAAEAYSAQAVTHVCESINLTRLAFSRACFSSADSVCGTSNCSIPPHCSSSSLFTPTASANSDRSLCADGFGNERNADVGCVGATTVAATAGMAIIEDAASKATTAQFFHTTVFRI